MRVERQSRRRTRRHGRQFPSRCHVPDAPVPSCVQRWNGTRVALWRVSHGPRVRGSLGRFRYSPGGEAPLLVQTSGLLGRGSASISAYNPPAMAVTRYRDAGIDLAKRLNEVFNDVETRSEEKCCEGKYLAVFRVVVSWTSSCCLLAPRY